MIISISNLWYYL